MQRKLFMMALAAIMLMVVGMPNVMAIHVDEIDNESSNITVEEVNGVSTLTLTGDVEQDLEILSDEEVILDLAGHTFKNYTSTCSVIWIHGKGKLTIIDSSEEQTGKIVKKDGSDTSPVINVLADNSFGLLTIEGGTISATIAGSAAVYNAGRVTINGGTIETTVDGVWGLMNKSKATITGGKFIQGKDFSIVYTEDEMTISGGEFTAEGEGHNSLITNKSNNPEDYIALLEITGGTFSSKKLFSSTMAATDKIVITGGKFSQDVSKYLGEDVKQDENGNVISSKTTTTTTAKTPEASTTKATVKPVDEQNPNTGDHTPVLYGLAMLSLAAISVAIVKFRTIKNK